MNKYVAATKRFEAKAAVAKGFEINANEIHLFKELVDRQPHNYRGHLRSIHPAAERLITYDSSHAMQTQPMHLGQNSEYEGQLESHLAVFMSYDSELNDMVPCLHVPIESVIHIASHFDVLFSSLDEGHETERARMEMTTAAASWYAMAKWSMDRVYTLIKDKGADFVTSGMLAKLSGYTQHDVFTSFETTTDALSIIRQRLAGAHMYRGLILEASKYPAGDAPSALQIEIFHAMYSKFFDEAIEKDRSVFTPLKYSIAKSLTQQEADEFIAIISTHYLV